MEYKQRTIITVRKSNFSYMTNLVFLGWIMFWGFIRIWRVVARTSIRLDGKHLIVNVGRYFVQDRNVIPYLVSLEKGL